MQSLKVGHHILEGLITDTRRALNSGFNTVNLHRHTVVVGQPTTREFSTNALRSSSERTDHEMVAVVLAFRSDRHGAQLAYTHASKFDILFTAFGGVMFGMHHLTENS
jgi:hypothetical protein